MKRHAQTGLVSLAVACSLVLSGTATIAWAARAGVPGWAQLAAVGAVEVVLSVGTWLWITEPRLRREAAAAVLLGSSVSAYAGVHAYGLFGLVGPVGAIVTTHLVARAWSMKTPVQEPDAHREPVAVLDVTEGLGPAGLTPRPALDPPAQPQPAPVADEREPEAAPAGPDRYDEAVAESLRLRREGLRGYGGGSLETQFGLSEWRAKEAAAEAKRLFDRPVRPVVNG